MNISHKYLKKSYYEWVVSKFNLANEKVSTRELNQKVLLLTYAFLGFIVSLQAGLTYGIAWNHFYAFIISMVFALIYLFPTFFINKNLILAKNLFALVFLVNITVIGLFLYTVEIFNHFFFVLAPAYVYFFFSKKEKLLSSMWIVSVAIAFVITEFNWFDVEPLYDLTEVEIHMMRTENVFAVLIIIIIINYVYSSALEKNEKEALLKLGDDSLTGLKNRYYFSDISNHHIRLAKRGKHPFCLAFLDIDCFKQLNDDYGHDVGDEVLIELANMLINNTRESDVVFRFGGEEFIILMVDVGLKDAVSRLEKIRQIIAESETKKSKVTVTASFGVTEYQKDDFSIEDTIKRADKLMYIAKENGKNRIEHS